VERAGTSAREPAYLVAGDIGEPDLLDEIVDPRGTSAGTVKTGQRGKVPTGGQ
jgi:hypothetical protein